MRLLQKFKKALLTVCSAVAILSTLTAVAFTLPAKDKVTAENTTVDFSSSTAVSDFAVANADKSVGTITDGKYYPIAWAQNYYKVAIPTDQTRLVSLDFYLPSIEDTGSTYSQMWLGLITDPADINTAGKSLSMQMGTQFDVSYFYQNAQKAGTYKGQFSKMTFGEEHHLDILIDNSVITYAMDGATINFTEGFTTVVAPSNGTDSNAYLFFEFSSNKGYVDNIVVSDCTELDFSSDLVAQKYINVLSGGTKGVAAEGVFKPAAWGRNYWVTPIDLTKDVVISYDFYMPGYETLGTADNYSQFYASLVSDLEDINGETTGKSIAFRIFDTLATDQETEVQYRQTSYSVWPTAQSAATSASLAWLEDVSYFDAVHHMDIKVVGGSISYCVDDVTLFGTTFTAPADSVYFFFEMSHAGGYIDNLKTAEIPFEEISLDFSDSSQAANFTNIPSATNWSISNETFKSGGTYRATYMTTPIPVNEFKYIAFDLYEPYEANTSSAANFRMGLTCDIANRNSDGNSIGIYFWSGKTYLTQHANSATGEFWLKTLSTVTLGQVNRVEMIVQDEKITFIVGGVTLQSSYAIPFCDQNTSTKEYAYLVLDDAVGAGAYIDNLVVLNKDSYDQLKAEQLEQQYGIEVSDKSFVGYDEKKTPNTTDINIAWGTAYTALTDGATVRRSTYYGMQYDWSGAEYYAFDFVNETEGFVAFGLDVKEWYYAQNVAIADWGTGSITHGRWWTMGESMPYYLVYADGTVKSGVTGRNTLNRGKAVLPTGFKGTLIFPISSFEVLDWSANTAQYDWFTDDANVLALDHILFADVIYCSANATTGSITTSNERLLSSDFGAAASVARTIRAIDQIGTVSAASERLIAFARENYDALTAEQQAEVTNYATLTAAETDFYGLDDYSYAVGTNGKDFEGTGGVSFGSVFSSAPSTVSAWIRVSEDIADDEHVGTVMGNAERKMSSSVLYDYWNTFSFEITTNGNPKFEWRVSRTNKAVFIVENADVRTGDWMHVAFTRDLDNGLLTCYINGKAVASMEVDPANIANFSFVKPVKIGSDYTDDDILALSFTPDFHGSIANVRVYSTLLNENEVGEDMCGTRAGGLLGGIDFASGESEEYYDYVNDNAVDAFGWQKVEDSYFAAEDGEFTFAIIPDTQMIFSCAPADSNGVGIFKGTYTAAADGEVAGTWESEYNVEDNLGFKNMQWLIDNKDMLNLQYVMHVGDLTDNLNYYSASNVNSAYKKWQIEGMIEADYGFQMLNKLTTAGIPWSISRGNHDGGYDASALAVWDKYWTQSKAYAKAMTDDRLEGEPAKYCVTTRNSVDHIYSYYEKIEINGMKYLILVLDLEASDTVLAWANEVAAYFTDYKIIVSTHAYLGSRAGLMTSLMGSADLNNAGQTVWDEFVSKHANIELMICGHSSGEDIVRKQMTGVNGNKVWTFMIDSSAHEFTGVTQPGLMSLLKFSADGKTLTLNHYSMVQGEIFGDYNSFTVNLGEQEETSSGDSEEVVTPWPDQTDTRQIVLMPNIQPFPTYTSSNGLQFTVEGTPSAGLQLTSTGGIQFRSFWQAYGVTIDITDEGIFKFSSSAKITSVENGGYIAVLQTCAKDGLTRVVPLIDPNDTDTCTISNNIYGLFTDMYIADILPDGISVATGDKITLVFSGSSSWGYVNFNGVLYNISGEEIKDYTLGIGTSGSVGTAAAQGLYNAGYNGILSDGTVSSTKNYNGFTAGWLHLTGSFANFFTQFTNTVTVNDESGNTLFTATSSSMGSYVGTQNKLPTLKKDGYIFKGYNVGGTIYAGDTYSVNGTTASGGTTQTVIALFEKAPEAIFDTDGRVVVDLTNADESFVLPELTRSGRIFLGYAIDGELYPAGTVIERSKVTDIQAVFAEFGMMNGASIRLNEPTGMRFQTYLNTDAYEYMKESVTFGTLIAKADDITVDGVIDYSLLTTDATITKLNVPSSSQHTVGGYLYFNGVISSIKAHHYDWKFAARAHMTVTYADGTKATFYATVTDNARSVREIAEKALNDISKVQSGYYSVAVEGGYSPYDADQRIILEGFLTSTEE